MENDKRRDDAEAKVWREQILHHVDEEEKIFFLDCARRPLV